MEFKKYGKTPKLRKVVKSVQHRSDFKGLDSNGDPIYEKSLKPAITFTGTIKLHGCLPGRQKITMFDGSKVEIKKIKVGDKVLGFDFSKNKIVPSKVLNTSITGETNEWYIIERDLDRYKLGQNLSKLKLTPNHKVYTDKGYIEAKKLCVGDKILSNYMDYKLNDDVYSIL